MSGVGKYATVEMDEKKSEAENDELEQPFDEDFWRKVVEKFDSGGISWTRAMDEVRTERLMKDHEKDHEKDHQKDCLLMMIRDWPKSDKYKGKPKLVASLEYLISRFTEIILEKDTEEEYECFRDESIDAQPTLLHLAAAQNFTHVATHLVKKYPSLVYLKTKGVGQKKPKLSVELALEEYNDETAAFLVSHMKRDWIHKLFLYSTDLKRAKFSFGELISHRSEVTNKPDMNKTVVAVLDCLINPYWPYLPREKHEMSDKVKEHIERAWSSEPDNPLDYDFVYHVLDGDSQGRQPKIGEEKNKEFDAKSKSCLRHLTESNNKEAILHPVVRMLVMRKWKKFGRLWFCLQAICYVIFLALLSYALLYGATREDPNNYDGSADNFRLLCEVLSIIFLTIYIFEEICQAVRESKDYFKDPYNYFDWLGLILTLLVIPLRFADASAQWSVASLGYLFNFLRIFKFSCVTRTTGLYTKTLAKIIYRDISRFLVVFVIVCLGFCGAMFMALTATGLRQELFSNYGTLMLAAVRVLTEQQPVEEDYGKFNWLTILILLGYMGMVIVVLLNVLIAQLSYTYSEAKNSAKLLYAIDRMSIITRLEQSRLGHDFVFTYLNKNRNVDSTIDFSKFFRALTRQEITNVFVNFFNNNNGDISNFRVKYYKKGGRFNETVFFKELLEYSEERHPWESMEEKLTLVRDLMRKVFRRGSDKSE